MRGVADCPDTRRADLAIMQMPTCRPAKKVKKMPLASTKTIATRTATSSDQEISSTQDRLKGLAMPHRGPMNAGLDPSVSFKRDLTCLIRLGLDACDREDAAVIFGPERGK